jgi:autotransporter-associated beta strand protein
MNLPTPQLVPGFRATLLVITLALIASSGAQAASITYLGLEPGTAGSGYAAQNWSNPGVAKTYDLSGDVYGTAGYYQIRPIASPPSSTIYSAASAGNNLGITEGSNPTLYSAPVMLSSITGGAGDYVNFNSYPLFRGPDGSTLYTQGGLSVAVNQGPYNTPSGANNGYFGTAFSFTMGTSATYRVGVAVDTVASGTYAPNYVSIYNNGTGSVYSGSLTRDGTPDMTVFEINAAAGDSFTTALWQLSGTQSAAAFGLITFDVSSYNLNVASGMQTNSSALGGAPAALLKTGAGTMVLTGASTYTGATTISNGAVQLGGGGTLAGGAYGGAVSLATNSSSLAIATSANQILSGAISGSGSLAKSANGTLTLSGSNSYTGATVVSGGTLRLDGSGALSGSTTLQVDSGATFSTTGSALTSNNVTVAGLTGSGTVTGAAGTLTVNKVAGSDTFSGTISGGTALAKSAAGTLTLSGSNSYSGGTTISGGRVITTSSDALGDASTAITVSGGAYLDVRTNMTRTGAITFDGGFLATSAGAPASLSKTGGSFVLSNAAEIVAELGGTAGITSGGTGTSILWRSNSYTGATVVNSGTLSLNGAGAISSNSAVAIASGAAFNVTGSFAPTNVNRTVAGLTGAGVLYGAGGTVTVNLGSGTNVFTGDIQGGQGLIKSGASALVLGGPSSYTGTTTINEGRIVAAHGSALGGTAAGTVVASGAQLMLSNVTVGNEALTISGNGLPSGSSVAGALRSTGTNTYQGKVTLGADAGIFGGTGTSLTLDVASGDAVDLSSYTLTVDGAGASRINDAIVGSGGLTKSGSANLTLVASNSYSGATTLSAGRITLSGNGRLGSGAITIATSSAGTLELAVSGTNNMANNISGAGSLFSSSGETRFTGAVTTTGGLTVSNSTVRIGNGGTTGSYSGNTVLSDAAAQLVFDRSDAYTHSGTISGSGSVTKVGAGTSTLAGLNTYNGGTFLNGGWLVAGHTNAFGTGSITVGSGTTLNLTNFNIANLVVNNGGTILSTGTLDDVIATNGTTDIGGDNSTIEEIGGTAVVNVTGSSVVVSNTTGGTLNADGTGVQVASVSGGTVNLGGSSAAVTAASGGTVNANASGVTLGSVSGSATVNVSGENGRVGTLSGGSLAANAAGLVVTNYNGGNIAISNGVSLGLRSGSSSGIISGAGGMDKESAGTLTLSGVNTYTGATSVKAGALVVNGSINSAATVQSGATLGGSGTVASATIQSGGTVGPGNSPGTLTITNGLTWAGGGNYNWQIFGVSGTAGATNTWDLISVTGGTWDINGLTSTNKFNINLWSLSGLPDTTGPVAGFDATQNYSWMILASGALTGTFNTNLFNINTSAINGTGGFTGATGLFSLAMDGNNDLFLNYTGAGAAVPEPGTWAAGGLLLALAAFARRRAKVRSEKAA